MINLSVVIITYNEEAKIKFCLESVRDIADEIIIVDSFSTDQTEQICKNYNVHFIQNKFQGHIQQKNYAISKAKFDYILSLDADEVLSNQLKENIKRIKQNFSADGYSFNRLNNYCGKWIKHGSWYPDRKLRLWDRRLGQWEGENPHDRFKMIENAKIEHIKGDLLHYTISEITEHINQVYKFSTIGAQSDINRGKRSSILKIIINPLWKFLRDYLIKMGFLDGYEGFQIAIISAFATFLKYSIIKQTQNNANTF